MKYIKVASGGFSERAESLLGNKSGQERFGQFRSHKQREVAARAYGVEKSPYTGDQNVTEHRGSQLSGFGAGPTYLYNSF